MPNLYVREIETREIVDTIEVSEDKAWAYERIMAGMLKQMDTERYFIDDSEFDDEPAA